MKKVTAWYDASNQKYARWTTTTVQRNRRLVLAKGASIAESADPVMLITVSHTANASNRRAGDRVIALRIA
jgi:hypothetical protein